MKISISANWTNLHKWILIIKQTSNRVVDSKINVILQ